MWNMESRYSNINIKPKQEVRVVFITHLCSRHDRIVCGQWIVNSRIRNKICLELTKVNLKKREFEFVKLK